MRPLSIIVGLVNSPSQCQLMVGKSRIDFLHFPGSLLVEIVVGREQSLVDEDTLAQIVAHAKLIVFDLIGIPVAVAPDLARAVCQTQLIGELIVALTEARRIGTAGSAIERTFDALADIEVARRRHIVAPPLD